MSGKLSRRFENDCAGTRWSFHAVFAMFILVTANSRSLIADEPPAAVPSVRLLAADAVEDQDDMCVWVDHSQPDRSVVIASDKTAGKVFVYDLKGRVLQVVPVTKPGNIDIRQHVTLGDRTLDLVVFNQRADGFKLVVFQLDGESRQLQRVDNNDLTTGPNYGGCLYLSRKTGRASFVCTSESGTVEQYELTAIPGGRVGGRKLRAWPLGKCEGAVADDDAAVVFISEESKGVWRFPAEPDEPATGTLVAAIGANGLKGDIEGLALIHGQKGEGFLVVSDQGRNRFAVFQRQSPHAFVGEFSVEGAEQTDGIEAIGVNLGPEFPGGLFACHTDRKPRAVLLTPLETITSKLPVGKTGVQTP
jgi:3-phytase